MTVPTIAVLAHRGDLAAVGLAGLLSRRGRTRVVYADDATLAGAAFTHRPSSGSAAGVGLSIRRSSGDSVQLPHGAITEDTDLVLCRLAALGAARQATAGAQEYADAEIFALALSWLAGLGDVVVNRPSPMGLAGAPVDVLRLHRLAAAAGLATPQLELTSNAAAARPWPGSRELDWVGPGAPFSAAAAGVSRVGPPLPRPAGYVEPASPVAVALVLGRQVVDAPPGLVEPARVLAAAAGLTVAEITFAVTAAGSGPVVTELTPVPRLAAPGHLAAMAGYLEERAQDRRTGQAA